MTLRLPTNHLSSPCNFISKNTTKKTPLSISSILKQKQPKKGIKIESPFLLNSEETATRFGLDLTIEDLERLFHHHLTIPGGLPPSDLILSPGRRHPLRIAYQGSLGSYCQEAATETFTAVPFDLFPCESMEDAFSSLEDFFADRAVVPAENSIDGPIDRNLDLLLRHDDVNILGELVLPVNHCLISLPNVKISELRRVVSHPQALSHCKNRLEKLDVNVDEVDSAAEAAQFIAENRIGDIAVIGSKMAAKEFGLQVLERNFQDPIVNFNRYLQLGLGSGSGSKTTVAFSLENGVSDLFRAMWVFEVQGVKVTRVEHRPNRVNPIRIVEKESGKAVRLDYVFVLDLEGNGSDSKVKAALTGIKEIASFLRVLGSYCSTCENASS